MPLSSLPQSQALPLPQASQTLTDCPTDHVTEAMSLTIKNALAWAGLILAAVALAGCTTTGQLNSTGTQIVATGQLYCALATANGPLVVALADQLGAPITVTNKAASDVAAACAIINAIPVTPPAGQATPVVSVNPAPAMANPPATPTPTPAKP
jgi:hypothetical protein